ncbi:TRAP transporter small permease [Nisaea nitritireducens]|uniref:TRAP transporter small permease n=1 Tax=Nisaea nitritireducens TaxID=568392 RepID=UPI0018691721|nr:TRAP transporter small permease [Nisaea nitritireducens]
MAARRLLDGLYLWSGYLAAFFLVAISLTIVAQIIGRFFGVAIDSTESAGFSLAASTFLGLAYTFRHDGHIRVTLLIRLAKGPLAKLTELWSVGFCAAAMGYLTYWACDLVYFSYIFGDISPGLLAIPFWIPRSAMALGSLILTIALIDEFIGILRGQTPSYIANSTALFKGEDD